ncbi:MAG: hypothetical protein IKQ31_00435 [Clostridia bacterium]|nr:hypothetical protein [Clostridia bacterium]
MRMKSIFCSAVALVLVLCFMPLTYGCGGGKQYSEFTVKYNDFVKENNDIFDANGAVRIAYSEDVENVINNNSGSTVEEKLKKFPRLCRIASSNQAIYEPIFKACMLYVGSYINSGEYYNISDKESSKLKNKLNQLDEAIEYFRRQKVIIDDHSYSFYTTSQTENNNLEPLLDALYDVVIKSSELANAFADVYEKVADKKSDVVTFSDVERFYLRSMVRMSNIYTKVYLPLIHNSSPAKSLKNPTKEELYTEYAFSDLVNKILQVYTLNQPKIHGLATKTSGYSSAEMGALNYYSYILEYETVVKKAQNVMLYVADDWLPIFNKKVQIDFANTNPTKNQQLTTKEQSYLNLMDDCYAECMTLDDMLNTLANSV